MEDKTAHNGEWYMERVSNLAQHICWEGKAAPTRSTRMMRSGYKFHDFGFTRFELKGATRFARVIITGIVAEAGAFAKKRKTLARRRRRRRRRMRRRRPRT